MVLGSVFLGVSEVWGRTVVMRVTGVMNLAEGRQVIDEVNGLMVDRPGQCVMLDCENLVDMCSTAQRFELVVRMRFSRCRWVIVGRGAGTLAAADSLIALAHNAGIWIDQADSMGAAKLLVGH